MTNENQRIDTFANRLKIALNTRNTTAAELASKAGLSKAQLSQYTNGVYEAKQKSLYKLAQTLNVNEAWLMGYDVPMEKSDLLKSWEKKYNPDGLLAEQVKELSAKNERDIAKRLEHTLADLENQQEALMFSGEPLDDETRELLKSSLENSLKMGKIIAKQKFTPNRYKN